MELFLKACVAGVNIPYTIMLAVACLYWLSVIIGVFDLDLFGSGGGEQAGGDLDVGDAGGDLHLGADADGGDIDVGGHADAGGDADVDVDLHADAGFLGGIPKLLQLGGVPVTIFASFFSLSAWAISLTANFYLGNTSLLVAFGFFFPIVLISLLVAKIASAPFGSLFRALGKESDHHEKIVGKICVITTSRVDGAFGQAEVATSGAPHLLTVRTVDGITIKQGEQALVIRFDSEKHIYIVQPYTFKGPELEDKRENP